MASIQNVPLKLLRSEEEAADQLRLMSKTGTFSQTRSVMGMF